MMKRRTFLRGTSLAAVAPLVTACARALHVPVGLMTLPEDSPGIHLDDTGLWREAVAFARWAPSPHNIQPWRVRVISGMQCELYCDPSRLLPVTDPTGAFTTMGMAMFVEYLSVAAAPHGYAVRAQYEHHRLDFDATEPFLFATLALEPSTTHATVDRQLILDRRTSRLPYDDRIVEERALTALSRIAREHGYTMGWSSDKAMVDWMVDLNRDTLFADLADDPTRRELRRWIRTTDEEAEQKKDGLWSHCLRFPGWLLKAFFDDHEKWGHGWRKQVCGNMLVNGMRGTRTVAWWSGPFSTPEQWTQCGAMLAHSWLEMTRQGIGMHPFGSIITNPSAHARLGERLAPVTDGSAHWLLVRLGHSDVPPRSLRVDASAIFMNDNMRMSSDVSSDVSS